MTQNKSYTQDDILKLCTPTLDENDLNWMSNFAIYISVITGKNSPYSKDPCAETGLTKVFKYYAFASEPYTFKSSMAKSSFDDLYSVWKELSPSNKDMFEEYLAGSVPVMGDDFGKKKKEKTVTKCEDFYKPIISAFKTRDAELKASDHLALEFKNFTHIVAAQARDADEPRAADQAIDDALAEMEYAMYASQPVQPMKKNTPSAADIMNDAQKEYWENKKADGGSSRKYIRRRFKKSKSRSKKLKPKSKSKPTLKSNRKSKSKSKSKTKRRHKK